MFTHTCIKNCGNTYESEEPEAYYCPSCEKTRQAIAKEIDAKFANRPKKELKSALQEYDEAPKVMGRFIKIKL